MNPGRIDPLVEASRAVETADLRRAFRSLRRAFLEPDLAERRDRFVAVLRTLSTIGCALAGAAFGALVDEAEAAPDDPRALYNLGFELIENRLPDIAACVLTRAHRFGPGNKAVVTELVAALEAEGRNAEACRVLWSEPELCQGEFLCRYLLAFHSIQAGNVASARELAPTLEEPTDANERFLADRIHAMLDRAEALATVSPLDKNDLRGWHFVATGGGLLHLSPYGIGEGMRGRYAFTQDSEDRCGHGIELVRLLLSVWDLSPERILVPPDPDSRILALAASRMLGLDVADFSPEAGPGLIVVYDLSGLDRDATIELLLHRPGQVLFAHAACWTDPPACAPDVVTYLYQINQCPWGNRLPTDDGGQPPVRSSSAEPPEAIAERISASQPDVEWAHGDNPDALEKLWRAMRNGAAAFRTTGRRSPLWPGGPVKSNRFR